MKARIFILIIIIINYSCERKKYEDFTEINMSLSSNSKEYCELVDEIKFVELETSENSLIGIVDKVKIINNKIFIHDLTTQNILIFDYPSGNYISSINSIGNGPGEYLSIVSFEVIDEGETVEILNGNLRKLFKYDIEGNFISYRNIPFYANSFHYFNNEIVFSKYSISEDSSLDGYELLITDNDFNIINKYAKIPKFTSMLIEQGNQVSFFDNQISFLPTNSPYIYNITKKGVISKYYLNFKENWDDDIFYTEVRDPRKLNELLNKRSIVNGIGVIEVTNEIIVDFWFKNNHYLSIYNKESKKTYHIKKNKLGMENRTFFKGVYEDYVISVKPQDDLYYISKNDQLCFSNDIINPDTNNNKNPYLVLTKFKSDL